MAQSQSSTSVPGAQADPFHEFFRPNSPSDSSPDSREIPDPQESSESTNTPVTSRDDRIAIQTALKFKIPHAQIRKVLGVTESQIKYTQRHHLTSRKSKTAHKPLLRMPQRNRVEQWLLESSSHRRIQFQHVPR